MTVNVRSPTGGTAKPYNAILSDALQCVTVTRRDGADRKSHIDGYDKSEDLHFRWTMPVLIDSVSTRRLK